MNYALLNLTSRTEPLRTARFKTHAIRLSADVTLRHPNLGKIDGTLVRIKRKHVNHGKGYVRVSVLISDSKHLTHVTLANYLEKGTKRIMLTLDSRVFTCTCYRAYVGSDAILGDCSVLILNVRNHAIPNT